MTVDPRPGADETVSVPPCASVIERAMNRPSPVPGYEAPVATRPNFSKITR